MHAAIKYARTPRIKGPQKSRYITNCSEGLALKEARDNADSGFEQFRDRINEERRKIFRLGADCIAERRALADVIPDTLEHPSRLRIPNLGANMVQRRQDGNSRTVTRRQLAAQRDHLFRVDLRRHKAQNELLLRTQEQGARLWHDSCLPRAARGCVSPFFATIELRRKSLTKETW